MIILAGLLVALASVILVLEPILRPAPAQARVLLEDSDDEIDPVQRRRDRALAALKEIAFDRATGKLSDEDYEQLNARYSAEAVEAIKAADARPADPLEEMILRARAARAAQAAGAEPAGGGFCTECGAPLEGQVSFCIECGSRIAA